MWLKRKTTLNELRNRGLGVRVPPGVFGNQDSGVLNPGDSPSPLPIRAYQFPSATYLSIWISKDWSATKRLRRLFSPSSSFSRLASADFIPPYCISQRSYVDSLTSKACSTAAIFWPHTASHPHHATCVQSARVNDVSVVSVSSQSPRPRALRPSQPMDQFFNS